MRPAVVDSNTGTASPVSMGSASEYVRFFIGLNMGRDVSLQSFLSNEKRILEKKGQDAPGIRILEGLQEEVAQIGERTMLEKYGKA